MPDEFLGTAAETNPSGGSAPPAAPAPSPSAPAAAPQSTSQPAPTLSAPAPQAPQAAPAATQQQGVRDLLRNFGVDFSAAPDDNTALQHLANVYRESQNLRQLAGYGQQYVQHADQFQAYLKQQQEVRQREEQAKQQSWWKAPEYDPSWSTKLVRDPNTGAIGVVPGADPSLAGKYMAWVDHQRGFLDKFSADPVGAIRPGIEQVARQVAQELIGQQLGGLREQTAAQQFVQQNSDWLHARNQDGSVAVNPQTGMPALSPMGQRFAGYVQEAESLGLREVAAQQKYALANVQRDYLLARSSQPAQQQPQVDPAVAAQQQFLATAAGQRQPAVPPGNVNGSPPPVNTGTRGLMDQMLADMQAAGFQPGQRLT